MYSDRGEDHHEKPTDRLERQLLPPTLEEAEAEYFADMAFDDRLLRRLENEAPTVVATFSHTVTSHQDGIASRYFPSNATETLDIVIDEDTVEQIEQLAFTFTLQGTLLRQGDSIDLTCAILPEDTSAARISLRSDADNNDLFYLSKQGADGEVDVDLIDSKSLFTILCQLGGANIQSVNGFINASSQHKQNGLSDIHTHIESVWGQLAETHGKKEVVHQLVHEVATPLRAEHPEAITLTRREIEEPQRTLISLNLEHAITMPELDAQEAYCLQLTFEHTTEQSVEKNAEKIIRSTNSPRLVSLSSYRKDNGRVTPLDINDIKVKELFINWFDQVVSD